MTEPDQLEGLDRELERLAPSGAAPDAAAWARRARRMEREPWLDLAFALLLVGVAWAGISWLAGLGLAMALLPSRAAAIRRRGAELAALAGEADLAQLERAYHSRRLGRERFRIVFELGTAAVLAAVALATGAHGILIASAGLGGFAAARLAFVLPPLLRANRDAGGEEPPGWLTLAMVFAALIALPFYAAWRALAWLARRLGPGDGGRA
jgi:hypothetical protein